MRRVVRLGCQHHALRNAEAVLFINDGKGEVFVFYRLLKNGVRADKNVYGTVRQPHERGLARASLLPARQDGDVDRDRSEEHTSELQSLMRISYAVFCLKKNNTTKTHKTIHYYKHNKNATH